MQHVYEDPLANLKHLENTHARAAWPGHNGRPESYVNTPMLVTEMYQLVPYKLGNYINFHPKNMPDIRVKRLEVAGLVTSLEITKKHLFMIVDDATAAIKVKMRLLPDTKFAYLEPKIRGKPEKSWGEMKLGNPCTPQRKLDNIELYRTRGVTLGNEVTMWDHVHLEGYCAMEFKGHVDYHLITEDQLKNGHLYFHASKLRRLHICEYQKLVLTLINDIVRDRIQKR